MKPKDKHYLALQFRIKIHIKEGTEFQSFFEEVMKKALPGFRKIRPQGQKGDAGNDGYIKDNGTYFQVYAPNTPKVNETRAAEKLADDFFKLKNGWDQIAQIKEYNFAYNDKYDGSVQLLEETITRLNSDNPHIKFKLFLADDFEELFLQLSEADILDLGFNIDHRQALEHAYRYLDIVRVELDREYAHSAQRILEQVKGIISSLDDDNLLLEYEILESRCLQKSEKVDDAKKNYESLSKRFPQDPRPLLNLAEMCLNDHDFDENKELLEEATKIDSNHWLLKLEWILRKLVAGESFGVEDIDELAFPDDPKIKANFYRLYALVLQNLNDQTRADSFIEKAKTLNPDRYSTYLDEITLTEVRMLRNQEESERERLAQELLDKVKDIEERFLRFGDIGARNKTNLNIKKINALEVQQKFEELENLSKITFDLAMNCRFDRQIDHTLTIVLASIPISNDDLSKLLDFLRNSKKSLTDMLSRVLIIQFNIRNALLTQGRLFFEEIQSQSYVKLIKDIQNEDHESILAFLKSDPWFAMRFANTAKNLPDLRRKIIEDLPDDGNIQKEKLRLLVNFDEQDFDQAFEILRELDLSGLSYVECRPILYIVQQKKAWDFEVIILKKLIEKERNEKDSFNLKFRLLHAYLNLKNFLEVTKIGEQLLVEDTSKHYLDPKDREGLLNNTLIGFLERGKIENDEFKKGKDLLQKFASPSPSFDFRVGVEAETYLSNNEPERALMATVEAIKARKILSPQEYGQLYFLFLRIGNQIKSLNTDSLDIIKNNTFVKLKDKEQWYFIGNENELDAILVTEQNNKYPLLIDKKLSDPVVFETKYSSEIRQYVIDCIYTIEKYILWKVLDNFQRLASDGDLEGVEMIEIPPVADTIDPKNILKFFEDLKSKTEPFFDQYIKNNLPLAMLAISEGGLAPAVARIVQEEKGYIHYSDGSTEELDKQKELAKRIIDERAPFYIDGTSALFLSESGILPKIYGHLPNLKVPQSVIGLLIHITDKFKLEPGQTGGHMGYSKGKITMSSLEADERDSIRSRYVASIKLLESKSNNIAAISSANKTETLSEQRVPPELCDACILAQKESIPVLTDDFLYLQLNESETKKKAPEYFSSLALVRVLYEEKQISFGEYLDYFGYLSSYRFRFLNLTSVDIQKAVFGDSVIKTVKPENIRKLNFPLTLSEGYGVPFQTAFRVMGLFFIHVLIDNAITADVAERIFLEILASFPTEMGKKEFGQILVGVCVNIIERNKSRFLVQAENPLLKEKINRLLQTTEIYNAESKLWTPK